MFNLKERPYNLLLFSSIIILVASVFASGQIFEFKLHDSYFIFEMTSVLWTIVAILLAFWGLYFLTRHLLFSKALTWIHVLLLAAVSIFYLAMLFYSTFYYHGLAGMPRRYVDYNNWESFRRYDTSTINTMAYIILMAVGFILYCANFLVGLFRKTR